MSLTTYTGFTLSNILNFNGYRSSLTGKSFNSIFNSMKINPTDFQKYVFYSTATERINFHIDYVLNTYPNGLKGVVSSGLTSSYSVYLDYLQWKQTATFLDNYLLDIMTATGSISSKTFSNVMNTTTMSIPWVRRTYRNDLIGYTISSLTAVQYSASSFDGYITE